MPTARPDRLDLVLTVTTAGLLVWTVAVVALPQIHVGTVLPAYDLVFDTIGLLATLAVALLGWVRYQEGGDSTPSSRQPRSSCSPCPTPSTSS